MWELSWRINKVLNYVQGARSLKGGLLEEFEPTTSTNSASLPPTCTLVSNYADKVDELIYNNSIDNRTYLEKVSNKQNLIISNYILGLLLIKTSSLWRYWKQLKMGSSLSNWPLNSIPLKSLNSANKNSSRSFSSQDWIVS